MSHYFVNDESLSHETIVIELDYRQNHFTFFSDAGVFSKQKIDDATQVLLDHIPPLYGSLLDIGCGYGVVGITLGKTYAVDVTMTDVNGRALDLARKNAAYNGLEADILYADAFDGINGPFDTIVSNPPIRAGKETVFSIYEGAQKHLKPGGRFYVVIRQKHGAPSTIRKLEDLFGNCAVPYKKRGLFVLECVK